LAENKLQQRFRAELVGVPILAGVKGRDRVLQVVATSFPTIEYWAAAVFKKLDAAELAGASVRVVELVEVEYKVIRPAKGALDATR